MDASVYAAEQLDVLASMIDDVRADDIQAWQTTRTRLDDLISRLPENQPVVSRLVQLCRQATAVLAEASAFNAPELVAALRRSLESSRQCVLQEADADTQGRQAGRDLKNLLSREQKHDDKEPFMTHSENAGSDPAVSLDDIASLLMQLDATSVEELQTLREYFQAVAANDSYAEPVRDNMALAVFHLDSITDGGPDDADLTLAEIGKLIEEAMTLNDMPAKKVSEPIESQRLTPASPSPSSDPEHSFIPSQPVQAPPPVHSEAEPKSTPEENFGPLPADADPELLAEFINEGADLISSAEEALLALETDPDDMDAVATVFRAFHTVKGTSAFMGLTPMSDMGHHAETLLSRVRDRKIRYVGGYADLALRGLDMLKELIRLVQVALSGAVWEKPEGYDELLELLKDPEGNGIGEDFDDTSEASSLRLGDILVAQGKADREALEKSLADQQGLPVGVALLKSKTVSATDVAHALRNQKRVKESHHPAMVESSVRVTTERLDRLIDMVGEMVIAHSMVAQDDVVVQANHHDLMKKVSHTSKIVRELQNLSMSMRMIPLKGTFQKMTRLVRDVSRKVGKNVNLLTEGDETEIDRNMVSVISDPLMHMVRNAVDHGIELPHERKAAGKPETGTVKLSAYHSAGSVIVAIKDDGKGMSKDAILAKAREKGLLNEGKSLSDREIFNLVFEPGFSTAQVVTDVSGRGVGMDVVKRNIETLRGQVDIQSEPGKGSIFRMSLPLTLAIIDGMVVRVGTERYIIPTVSIVRSIKPEAVNVSSVLHQGEMLSIQGKLIPLFRVARLYRLKDAQEDIFQALVVVVEDEGNQVGLVIDEMIGRQQIVIKTLGQAMANIAGISGGAIMPNGRVGLILDVGGLIKLANSQR